MTIVQEIHSYYDECLASAQYDWEKADIEKSRAIVVAYAIRYSKDPYLCIGAEVPFELPFPCVGDPLEDVTYKGIIDAVLEKDGQVYFCDHKTSGEFPNDVYWDDLKTNTQISQYWLAAEQMGIKLDGFVWDVIVKPKIRNKKLTKKDVEELENGGTYSGHPYRGDDWKNLRVGSTETDRMLAHRWYVSMVSEPQKHFLRRVVQRTPEGLLEYHAATEAQIRRLGSIESEGEAVRNFSSCKSYNRMCDYHRVCCGEDPEKESYTSEAESTDSPFPDLPGLSLSNSSLCDAFACERKWYYRKKEKIVRKDKQYQQALAMGSLVHTGLEMLLMSKPSSMSIEFKGNLCEGYQVVGKNGAHRDEKDPTE